MAASYSAGVTTPAAAAGATFLAILTGSSIRARIREIGFSVNAATASSVGLIRSATTGTASTNTLGQAQDSADVAATVNISTAWSSAPTISGSPVYFRQIALPAVAGSGVVWTWPADEPMIVPVSASVLLWNFSGSVTASAMSAYVVWEE